MSTPPDLGPLPGHPEPHTMQWTDAELRVIRDFGQRCYMLGVAAASQWRPIETAPKDEPVLVCCSHGMYVAEWRSHDIEYWHVDDNKHGPFPLRGSSPTHWMPLPAAPSEPTKEGG